MQLNDLVRPIQNQLRARARIIGLDHPDDIHVNCDGADPPNILYVNVGSNVRGSLTQIEELLREADSPGGFYRLANEFGLRAE